MQLSEEDFLSQVARSSSQEFNIFQKILEREERENAEVMEEDEDNLSTDEEYSENEEESDSDDEDYAESVQGDKSK